VELVVLLLALQQVALDTRRLLRRGTVGSRKEAADQENGRKLPEDSSPVRHPSRPEPNM